MRLRILVALVLLVAASASARPTYFGVLTQRFGLQEGDDLYTCGNCHFDFEGAGARNPFGSSIEDGLYLGKPIEQAITDAENLDPDGDGFSSADELGSWGTLPGLSCDNFFLVRSQPLDWHTFITPNVPSCLDPKDIRISPTQIDMVAEVGEPAVTPLLLINNGSDDPILVSDYGFDAGGPASLTVEGPAAPFAIQVGESAELLVRFDPPAGTIGSGTLRIASDDPDEGEIVLVISALGVEVPRAPAGDAAACLAEVDKHYRKYGKRFQKAWNRCALDELRGIACDAGRRRVTLAKAEAKLRKRIGGAKDKRCAGANLSPSLVGFDDTCGGGCGEIALQGFGDLVDCLVCRQEEAMAELLDEGAGTPPPDVPPNRLEKKAFSCQKKVLREMARGVGRVQQELADCELEGIATETSPLCAEERAERLADVRARVDARFDGCKDTAGMLGCRFDVPEGAEEGTPPDPACLGNATVTIGADLVAGELGLD